MGAAGISPSNQAISARNEGILGRRQRRFDKGRDRRDGIQYRHPASGLWLDSVGEHYRSPVPIGVFVAALGVRYDEWLDAAGVDRAAWGLFMVTTRPKERQPPTEHVTLS